MSQSVKKQYKLLHKGLQAVFNGDEKTIMKTARIMKKDYSMWSERLTQGITYFLPEASGITIEEVRSSKRAEEMADLMAYSAAKNLAVRLNLGMIEIRDNSLERLTYKGKLIKTEKLASLLVVAGHTFMSSTTDHDLLLESLKYRADYMMESAFQSVLATKSTKEQVKNTKFILELAKELEEFPLENYPSQALKAPIGATVFYNPNLHRIDGFVSLDNLLDSHGKMAA